MRRYSDLYELGEIMFVESNSHLESGKRLENWMRDEKPHTEPSCHFLGSSGINAECLGV